MNQSKPEPSAEAIALDDELFALSTSRASRRQAIDRYLRAAREDERTLTLREAGKDWVTSHGTFSDAYILECAGKAYRALVNCNYVSRNVHPDKPIAIICESFGMTKKDECREAFEEQFPPGGPNSTWNERWIGFQSAWKIAKESNDAKP